MKVHRGFRAVLAHDASGTLTGFAYGYSTTTPFPTGRSYDGTRTAIGAQQAARLCGMFEVLELAVHPDAKGNGIGRQLLSMIVAGQPAWLLTAEHARRAVAFYRRQGWQRLGAANGVVVYLHHP